jgi:hypothetical protein
VASFKITKNTVPEKLKAAVLKYHAALFKAAREVMEEKRTEVVKRTPKDVGTLRNTIHVEGPESFGKRITVSIVAGGPAAPYAIVQHENMQYHHEVGQAKYLESVILEARSTIGREIQSRVKM